MSDEQDDQDLRRRFLALRRAEMRNAPGFADPWRRAQGRQGHSWRPAPSWMLGLGAACALALVLVLVGVRHVSPPASPGPTSSGPSLTEWRPPTDFLLRTPALEVLTTVPVLGAASLPPRPSPPIERSSPS
jgi:hypothetical protein